MDTITLKIENCNNICDGKITIERDKLNIRYGMNGTGKSTISTAIDFASKNESLDDLRPFGSEDTIQPKIALSEDFNVVKIFNEQFVESMVFKESTVIDNAFDVFIRTPDYEQRRKELDERLSKLKVDIDSKPQMIRLKEDIALFSGKLELNAAGKEIKNNTNYKAIVKKKNIYNIPEKLKKYESIISDDQICIGWIDWKTKGDSFDIKGICPYCSDKLSDEFESEKKTFKDTYKKSDAQNLKNMLDVFENFHKYMEEDKFENIIACIKEEKEESAIKAVLKTFLNEYAHIAQQIDKMSSFDRNVFKQANIKDIDKIIGDMKFEKTIFNFFSSPLFNEIVDSINKTLIELEKEAKEINIAMGKLQSILKKTVTNSKKDINDFLKSAGMLYRVDIDLDETGQAIATLKYDLDEKLVKVDKIKDHLSWGERNAFSLILFMFFAISENADLIVLDDPISSFDTNKKYAIIYRMFSKQTGLLGRSFYKKTVLMLTHDFEPIIDFGVVGKLPEDALDIKFLKNVSGTLSELNVETNDIKSVAVSLKSYAMNEKLNVVHRIAFLRKFFEHIGIDQNNDAYNVLSSLIHGRDKCRFMNGGLMPEKEKNNGYNEIRNFINGFDYDNIYVNYYNEKKLSELYFAEQNNYLKMLLFRAIFEISDCKKVKEDDVLAKFINEGYHIENDYAYYLDIIKFETVPEYIIKAIDEYMKKTYITT